MLNIFYGCIGLASIDIPNSVTSIGSSAFANCSSLISVSIGSGMMYIKYGAFHQCNNLQKVIVNDISSWLGISFSYNESDRIDYLSSNPLYYAHHLFLNEDIEVTDLVIPEGITKINRLTFCGCTNITSISFPNSITSIGSDAFSYCTSLTSITIPFNLTDIENYAFYGCYHLNTIYSLNPTPPTCYGTSTFATGHTRSSYDIYNFANLHVPMGSKELYASSFDWCYFVKIKEDMELNGNIYYTNLTVQQGTTGYTRQAIKVGETYSIYIGSLGNNIVNAVTFNGVDVTDEIVNGYYTTPEIKSESVLSISYEIESSIPTLFLNKIKVTGYNGEINISNIDVPSDIFVYTVDGKLVESIPAAYVSAKTCVSSDQLYIIKVGMRTYKLSM